MTHSLLTLRWIPGTFDRVSVLLDDAHQEMSIEQVKRLYGRDALDSLYLRGVYTIDARRDAHVRSLAPSLVPDVAVASAAD